MLTKHVVATTIGLLLGFVVVAFLRPENAGGATIMFLIPIMIANSVAVLIRRPAGGGAAKPSDPPP